jgi:hypothetical protein
MHLPPGFLSYLHSEPILFAPTNSHLRVSSSREGAIWGRCSWLIDTTSDDERIQYCFRRPFDYCVHSVK